MRVVHPTARHPVSVLIKREIEFLSEVSSACRCFWCVMVRRKWSVAMVYRAYERIVKPVRLLMQRKAVRFLRSVRGQNSWMWIAGYGVMLGSVALAV